MYEILKIEKDTKINAIESLRKMLPYVIDTTVLTAIYRDAFINGNECVIAPYICSLIQLYGITYSFQFLKTYLENEKKGFSKTL